MPNTMPQSDYHVVGSYALLLARGLEDYGIPPETLFKDSPHDLKTIDDTEFRFPESEMTVLWDKATQLSGDDAFGLVAGTHVGPTSFHVLSMCLWLCCSLRQGFDRLLRYTPLFSTSASASLIKTDKHYRFDMLVNRDENNQPVACDQTVYAFVSALITICRKRDGAQFSPIEIAFECKTPSCPEKFEEFFGCPVKFNSPSAYILFDKHSLDKELTCGNLELFELSEQAIATGMERMQIHGIVGDIRIALKDLLAGGDISVGNIAKALNMSTRSLQRKLLEKELSYRQVLDDYRRELAILYIRQPKLSQGEISYMLGFSTPSNFSRAFKNWTGTAPGEYRSLNGS